MDESIITKLTPAPTSTPTPLALPMPALPLSAAIRLGCKLTQKCRGIYLDGRGGACAMGAALVGSLGYYPTRAASGLSRYPSYKVLGPFIANYPTTLVEQVIRWNDDCWMSREAIADRLEDMGY